MLLMEVEYTSPWPPVSLPRKPPLQDQLNRTKVQPVLTVQ